MDSTPLRVRGKRGQKRSTQGPPLFFTRDGKRTRRPVGIPSDTRVHGSTTDRKSRTMHLSRLEQLPTEIIQAIFICDPSLSLALSSPFIAKQLSDERIFFACALNILLSARASSNQDSTYNWASVLLRRRFMTWSLFKEVFSEFCRQTPGHPKEAPNFQKPSCQSEEAWSSLIPDLQIPEKLIRGPWSSDKAEFLYYLVWLQPTIDWSQTTLGEVAIKGLHQAVAERNRLVVASLLTPSVGIEPSMAIVRAAVIEHGCDRTIVWHLLNAAIRAHIHSRVHSRALSKLDITFRDPSIWSWAGRAHESGSEHGPWLKQALRHATDLTSAHCVYDETVYLDFVSSCGRTKDGVEDIPIPPSEDSPKRDTGDQNVLV